ncbi:hypothetical protein TVAG_093790 [Trichomonas vaginalis G3]|uniref:Leucine Rich Repeat family protein n=1 Tax=Trichomonas vaginalis (strain ATCC PRA-98 / G3) TaxID=412133 RepID=A2DBK2_TRIV3|nr:ribonuclease inhibitor domain-containing protein [Trichomonas vaginalis G3]EAY22205.1 hypothetical protein TVAG_093790 [Trichomonas vaginalis G3]KAI5533337.1 ribonuclease inhibitor domain-containing protein [Trichomonas vaginalis G3]|eukprot:XP_001583191.1 hypothetical protein [Trichomonas vaginalis G3]
MLSIEELKSIGGGEKNAFSFDLSSINSESLPALFAAIEKHGPYLIVSLNFNCDLVSDIDYHNGDPESISRSIAVSTPNFAHLVALCVVSLLKKSKIIETLHLANIEFEESDILQIFKHIIPSKIHKFILHQVPLSPNAVSKIFKVITKHDIRSLTLRHCEITDESVPKIISCIKANRVQFGKNLRKLDISDNDLSDDSLDQIGTILQTPISKIREEADDHSQEIERLRNENEDLKVQIERLLLMQSEIENHNALFVIGEGAPQLIERMKSIGQRVQQLSQ